MPKRNYGFEKRQKELNKQKKREEKQQRKLERKGTGDERPDDAPEENGPETRSYPDIRRCGAPPTQSSSPSASVTS